MRTLRYLGPVVILSLAGPAGLAPANHASVPAAPAGDTVALSITVGDRTPATLVVVSGRTATVAIDGHDPLGLTPIVTGGELTVRVRAIPDPVKGGSDGPVDFTVTLQAGGSTEFEYADTLITIRWAGSVEGKCAATPGQDQCGGCCVTCEGVRYCACKVVTVCLECCCPDCCNIIG